VAVQTSSLLGKLGEMNESSDEELELTEDDFFAALAAGNGEQAANVLRSLGGLGPAASEVLADLLEANPRQEDFFLYRLALRRWRPGRPRNLARGFKGYSLRLMIREKLKTEKKVHLAIAAVAKETQLSPATVWAAWGSSKKKTTPK
jgi:hypothetical protein